MRGEGGDPGPGPRPDWHCAGFQAKPTTASWQLRANLRLSHTISRREVVS